MINPSFVLLSNEKYRKCIEISIQQIRKFYPSSKIYFYDLSDHDSTSMKSLQHLYDINYIRWAPDAWKSTVSVDNYKFEDIPEFKRKITVVNQLKNVLKKILLYKSAWRSKSEKLNAFKFKEKILCEKPYIMLDASIRVEGKFVFLDADAFLVDTLDVLDDSYDIGVTLRRLHEINLVENNVRALNSGVIFFNGDTSLSAKFISEWISIMEGSQEVELKEQTALTRLVEGIGGIAFESYYSVLTMVLDNQPIRVKIFPCEKYNYNWVEEEFDLKKIKVLHLKSNRNHRSIVNLLNS